jgi:DNA-binding transcriptional regulator YdaS (Cro superfamily)
MKNEASPLEALKRAVQIAGGQTALAGKLPGNKKQGHVWNWLNVVKRCPPEMAIPIEEAVGRAVTRHDLRPDLYPSSSEGKAA